MAATEHVEHAPVSNAEHEVTVHVNDHPVHLPSHRVRGLAIKEAAIAQSVRIQLDFVLLEELEHNRTKPIADGEVIEVNDHSKFQAIPNDDHSEAARNETEC